jgi:molybdopterin/thiamine biosynthesis adenylyltransferase
VVWVLKLVRFLLRIVLIFLLAKNVALAGVKTLTLHDTVAASWIDLSTQFYLTSDHIGMNRAEASLKSIAELNPYTKCTLSTVDLATVELSYFDQFKVFSPFGVFFFRSSPYLLSFPVRYSY